MYTCSICGRDVIVDHINTPKKTCSCVGGTILTFMKGNMYGKSSFCETKSNNNLSGYSALFLKNTLFVIASTEFFHNKKTEVHATDIRVKDTETGREFSFTITGKEI